MSKNWNKIFGDVLSGFNCNLSKTNNGGYIFEDTLKGIQIELSQDCKRADKQVKEITSYYWEKYVLDTASFCDDVDIKDLPENVRDWGMCFLEDVIDWYTPKMKEKYPGKEGYVDVCECFLNHLDEVDIDKVYSYMHKKEKYVNYLKQMIKQEEEVLKDYKENYNGNDADIENALQKRIDSYKDDLNEFCNSQDIKWQNYENLVADRYGFVTSIELLNQAGFSDEEIKEINGYENVDVSKVLYPNEWFRKNKVDEAEKLTENGIRFAPYNDTLYNFYHNVSKCSACMLKADNSDKYWIWYSSSLDNEDLEEKYSTPVVIKDALWDKDHKSFILIGCSLNKGEFFEDENINLEFVSLEEGIKQIEKEYNKKFYHFNDKVEEDCME